ncbi:MAG: PKD domain-containing protein [Candidatus Margulisiibacteriota bacterium]
MIYRYCKNNKRFLVAIIALVFLVGGLLYFSEVQANTIEYFDESEFCYAFGGDPGYCGPDESSVNYPRESGHIQGASYYIHVDYTYPNTYGYYLACIMDYTGVLPQICTNSDGWGEQVVDWERRGGVGTGGPGYNGAQIFSYQQLAIGITVRIYGGYVRYVHSICMNNTCTTVYEDGSDSCTVSPDSCVPELTCQDPAADNFGEPLPCEYPPGGSGVSGSITCNGSDGSCTIAPGGAAVYSWNSSNSNNCQVTPYGWTGTSGSNVDYSPIARTVYLNCWNDTESKTVDTVQVIIGSAPPPPSLDITIMCNNTYGPCTVPSGTTVLITWNSTYDMCWINYKGNNENPDGIPVGHIWYTVYSSGPFTARCFQLTGGAEDSKSVDVIVPQLPVAVQLLANGSHASLTVPAGSTVNMSWTSQYADSCITSWAGSVPTNGSNTIPNITQSQTASITCYSVSGSSSSDQISITVTQPAPNTSTNVTATQPNYCVSGPAVTVSWTYSDPAGSPQSAYQVQITDTGNFNNPMFDSGKRVFNSNSFTTDQGILQFNTTYKARVRVWNSYDVVSAWSDSSSSWKTPSYAYPQVNFTWTANSISENPSPPLSKPVQFTDQTVFNGNPNGRRWSWTFGDGTSSTLQNPSKTYTAEGTFYVTLTATDNTNQSCSKTRGPLIIQKPIPRWREVAPK